METTESIKLLKGVREIHYGDPSAECFIGSVIAVMDYLNDPIEVDELFALSGAGLCFPWKEYSSCDEISIIPELSYRTFEALGYPIEYIYEPDIHSGSRIHSKEFYLKKIIESIDMNRPVIGFGFTNVDPFACVITGYDLSRERLYFRAYWEPAENLNGNQTDTDYYCADDWYDNCYGIVVVHEQERNRVRGIEAYNYIVENAKILKNIYSIHSQGKTIFLQSHAFDAMIQWLLNDEEWVELDKNQEVYVIPCGVLLLAEYRRYLYDYFIKLSKNNPNLVDANVFSIIEALSNCIGGEDNSFHLEKINSEIKEFEMFKDRSVREKVAAFIEKLKAYDESLFNCLIKN